MQNVLESQVPLSKKQNSKLYKMYKIFKEQEPQFNHNEKNTRVCIIYFVVWS